jgi:hypothetical protein
MTAYESILVNPVNGDYDGDYDSACWTFGGGTGRRDAWRALADLLADREGWHFDLDVAHQEVIWACGVSGEANLVIIVKADHRFYCDDHMADERNEPDPDATFSDIAGVEGWIAPREDEAGKLSATGRAWAQAAAEMAPDED